MSESPSVVICPACESASGSLLYPSPTDFEGYATEYEGFSLWTCPECASLYLNPTPTATDTVHFYPADYMAKSKQPGIFRRLTGAWDARSAAGFVKRYGKDKTYLDFGCGDGSFVGLLRDAGAAEASGYDPMPKLAGSSHLRIYDQLDQIPVGSIDIVVMNNVVEHLTELDDTMRRIAALLTPDGTLVLSTPNAADFTFRLFGSLWGLLHFPYHTVVFTPRGIELAAARWGFDAPTFVPNADPSVWAFSFEHVIKKRFGLRTRGHLRIYWVLLIASFPFWAVDVIVHRVRRDVNRATFTCELTAIGPQRSASAPGSSAE